MIEKLEQREHAYRSDDSIYYRITSFPEYGKLAKINFAGNIAGGSDRVDTDKYERKTRATLRCGKRRNRTNPVGKRRLAAVVRDGTLSVRRCR